MFREMGFLLWVSSSILYNGIYAQSNNIRFEHLTLDHGLSQSTVYSILQDDRGFMWFGTQDGLNRFYGYDFVVFSPHPSDSTSITDNVVQVMLEDQSGRLWLGTARAGLNRFDRTKSTFFIFVMMSRIL